MAVEGVVLRQFGQRLLLTERLVPLIAQPPGSVPVALHDIELAVDRRQPADRLDDDRAIHPLGDVVHGRREGAVVNECPGMQRLPGERGRLAGGDVGHLRAATGAVDSVEVDVVAVDAGQVVDQSKLDRIALHDTHQRPGHGTVECPEGIGRAVGQLGHHFFGRQRHLDGGRFGAGDGRRQVGGVVGHIGDVGGLRRLQRGDAQPVDHDLVLRRRCIHGGHGGGQIALGRRRAVETVGA